MRVVSTYDLRENLSDYLDKVSKTGDPVVVKRYGNPISVILPFDKKYVGCDFGDYFGFLKGGESGGRVVDKLRRNKKEKEYVKDIRG